MENTWDNFKLMHFQDINKIRLIFAKLFWENERNKTGQLKKFQLN